MNNYCVLITLLVFVLCSTWCTSKLIDEYCWRDYYGEVPRDALLVNEANSASRPVYIGQALAGEKLVPGKIYDGDSNLYYEFYDVEYSNGSNVKIFCTQNPKKFEWIDTHHSTVKQITHRVLVKGGYETNCDTFLGRVNVNGEILPGKVICCEVADYCYGLYTTKDGVGRLHTHFDILTYNENTPIVEVNKTNKKPPGRGKKNCKRVVINLYT